MESEEDTLYILYELPDINLDVGQPIHCTQRLKYTCLDVSKNLLVFGATSGGIYVFHRQPVSFIHLIPNKEGSVLHLKISPDEKYVCFATNNGLVYVKECHQQAQTAPLQVSKEHQGKEVTCIVWNEGSQELWTGDSDGHVSIMHITTFIAKTFNTSTFTLMRLDSKITQIEIYMKMLLVSTLTRTYICDTEREQYRQIGQKTRDGELGACFILSSMDSAEDVPGNCDDNVNHNQVRKEYSSMSSCDKLNGCENKAHVKIVCARPGLRLWEAAADGSVIKTYQFKQQLSSRHQIITNDMLECEQLNLNRDSCDVDAQMLNFSLLYPLRRTHICTHNKNSLFIIDPKNGNLIFWSTQYKDIKACKVFDSFVYLYIENGSVVVLNFVKLDKFIVNMYVNKKYLLCANLCALYDKYLIANADRLHRLSLLTKLGDVLIERNRNAEYEKIKHVLDELTNARDLNAQKLKSGIFVLKNAFYAQSKYCDGDEDSNRNDDVVAEDDAFIFPAFPPDAIQALRDLSLSVSDKLSVSTRRLKEKFDRSVGVERYEPMEIITTDRPCAVADDVKTDLSDDGETLCVDDGDVFNPSRNANADDDNADAVRRLYHHLKLYNAMNLDILDTANNIMREIASDVSSVRGILKKVESYAVKVDDSNMLSLNHCGKLFLYYISTSVDMKSAMESVVSDGELSEYFSTACMHINIYPGFGETAVSCPCGYPLPNLYSSQTPQFSNVIDLFIELQWNSSRSEHCYDICRKVPYMWRKILHLRRNEDLKSLLILLLQILDEDLLYAYLPHFTVEAWEKSIRLFSTVKSNSCLNCGMKFDKDATDSAVSWDVMGRLMIKSVGGANAVRILRSHARHVPTSGLSFAFYHSSALAVLFDKYDRNLRAKLTDTIYEAYKYPGTMDEIMSLLSLSIKSGTVGNTALPFAVASKSEHWGLKTCIELPKDNLEITWFSDSMTSYVEECDVREMTADRCLSLSDRICPNKDCLHCSLPLNSPVLIREGGLWTFACGHTFHGPCLTHLRVKLCPMCVTP